MFPPRRKLKSLRRREPSERRSSQGHAGESLRLGSWVCFPPGALGATWRSGDDIDEIEWWQGDPSFLLLLSPPCGSGTVPDLHLKPVGGFSGAWSSGVGSGRGGRQWQVQGCIRRPRCLRVGVRPATLPTKGQDGRDRGGKVQPEITEPEVTLNEKLVCFSPRASEA